MKQATQTFVINHFGTYKPGEFLPIWSGNELLNYNEFVAYKLKRAAKRYAPRAIAQFI